MSTLYGAQPHGPVTGKETEHEHRPFGARQEGGTGEAGFAKSLETRVQLDLNFC